MSRQFGRLVTVDDAIEELQGVITLSAVHRFRSDEDGDSRTLRGGACDVELEDFRFHEDGESHVAIRPKRPPRIRYGS